MAVVTELKDIPEFYDLYITEDITESLYSSLKKDIDTKLHELENIHENNIKYYRNNDIDTSLYVRKHTNFIIHLSTYGGTAYDGLGIYDLLYKLDNTPGINVTLICEGKSMSCGIPIMLAVKNRKGTKNSNYMIHQMISITCWKLDKMKEDVEECERLEKMIDRIILDNTKITREQLDDWYSHKQDFYFDAEQALKFGLINEII